MKKYGIFGGTFNPPHIAHSIVAESVKEQLSLDRIIFIPSGNPPLKKSIPAHYRLHMAKLAFESNKNFEVSDIEVKSKGKSYTVDTLQKLSKMYKDNLIKLFLIIGTDNLIDLNKWKNPERLFELCEVIVINRPNFSIKSSEAQYLSKVKLIDVPMLEISSTNIRNNVAHNKSIRYMVDSRVEKYIIKNRLYK